eukprot:CAMPEP_0179023856 /NCGR_PEP_ID=MMETSP0796-20121207/7150_1 /TAXON_ID=73915 /ORGANISM="Pyrodinium bahamense, Strain pbaha01" /LENGTH=84 /DNA_ID=CAMNT_0020719789 /DNA_START=120 /DNA_END=371 /DNA_ORIENTATION=+
MPTRASGYESALTTQGLRGAPRRISPLNGPALPQCASASGVMEALWGSPSGAPVIGGAWVQRVRHRGESLASAPGKAVPRNSGS